MRKIKYRAWLVNAQRMINVQEINFYVKTISYIEDDYESLEQSWEDEDLDNAILMQSTGVKDKNGVEIFEGDIVETPPYKSKYLVDYVDGSHVGRIDYRKYITLYKGLKVIGNIYENSEFLED